MELHLDRRISDRRIFPAFDLIRSGTRKEELLIPKNNLNRVWILRRLLQEMNPVDAMEFIIGKIKKVNYVVKDDHTKLYKLFKYEPEMQSK